MSDNAKVGQRVKKLEQFDEVDPNAANVVDLTLASTRVERAVQSLPASRNRRSRCWLTGRLRPSCRSVKRLVEELMDRGYAIVVSSTCESSSPLEFGRIRFRASRSCVVQTLAMTSARGQFALRCFRRSEVYPMCC